MLTTGQISLFYPQNWPAISDTTSEVGGGVSSNLINSTPTGLFPTGQSSVLGGPTFTRYAKVFFRHTGASVDTLSNPLLYITNQSIVGQINIAPDPYWLGIHAGQTGGSANRSSVPTGLTASNFSGYTIEAPLSLTNISSTGSVVFRSGNTIGVWARLSVPAGLQNSYENSFNLAIRGDVG